MPQSCQPARRNQEKNEGTISHKFQEETFNVTNIKTYCIRGVGPTPTQPDAHTHNMCCTSVCAPRAYRQIARTPSHATDPRSSDPRVNQGTRRRLYSRVSTLCSRHAIDSSACPSSTNLPHLTSACSSHLPLQAVYRRQSTHTAGVAHSQTHRDHPKVPAATTMQHALNTPPSLSRHKKHNTGRSIHHRMWAQCGHARHGRVAGAHKRMPQRPRMHTHTRVRARR